MKKLIYICIPVVLIVAFFWNSQQSGPNSFSIGINIDPKPRQNFRGLAGSELESFKAPLTDTHKTKLREQVIKNYLKGKDHIQDGSKTFKKFKPTGKSFSTREFRLKGQTLFISTKYSAVPSGEYYGGRSVATVNSHKIIPGVKGFPVVQHPIKKIKGVATGHIIVKAKADSDLSTLAKRHQLKVHHVVPHLNLISFIPEDKDKLLETSAKLSESDLVESVKLDISYGGPRAK